MLLRRTSAGGAQVLALVGLLGWASLTAAQQPPAAGKAAPPSAGPTIGAAIGDSAGMIALPIRAATDGTGGKGVICGKLTLGMAGSAGKNVLLVEGGKVVAVTKTDAEGAFEFVPPHLGEFTFMAGPFDANGAVRKMVRVDAAEGAMQAVVLQQKGAPPAALAGGVAGESVLSPIGNRASGNADVTFVNGRFVVNGQPVSAGNEYAVLENGSFRGIVTSLDDAGVRVPLGGANVYLIRRGQVAGRTVSGGNGSFSFTGVVSGGYTLLATVGGYGTAEVALNGVPGVDQAAVRPFVGGPAPAGLGPMGPPVASPYFTGMTAGVPGAVAVRFPFSAIAVQRIALRDGAVGPAGVGAADAEFRMEGADDVVVRVAWCQPAGLTIPVVNLSPAPWEDLRLFIGDAVYDTGVAMAPTPAEGFEGGGFGGGGGGGFGGAGLLGLAAAAAALAGGGGHGGGGNPPPFASPLRP